MTQTIAKQIKWDFETNGLLEIQDKNGRLIYSESPLGYWEKYEHDSKGNITYYERKDGFWSRREYDSQYNCVRFTNSLGYWLKWEYDSEGNIVYTEDSDGMIEDNRPKPCEDDYQAKAYNENEAIEMLRDVDGETMEHILRGIGMETQMLRQLILTAPMEQIEYLIEEKIGNQRHDTNN